MKKIIFITLFSGLIILLSSQSYAQQEATQEADEIRERVQEKIEEVKNKPVAYLGTVTDISENSIQIKNINDEIQQVTINSDETSFVKINDSTKVVSFSDVAIGDFLVNMGYRNENGVLNTRRILITDEPKVINRVSVMGEVVETKIGELSLKKLDTMELQTISISANTTITRRVEGENERTTFSQLEEGSTIIAVLDLNDNLLEARTIHIIAMADSD